MTAWRLLWRALTRARAYRRRLCSTICRSRAGALLAATHADAERGLVELQGILGEARLNDTAVAWLTSGAVATGPEEGASGLSRAPLWGLVRSARAEHPDRRLQLVDVDAPPAEAALLAKLLSTQRSLSWRCGMVRCWRRGWCVPESGAGEPRRLDADWDGADHGRGGGAGSGGCAAPG